MKTLILMRHAKAEAHAPDLDDIDRGLAPRGIASARALGAWLREHDLVPDLALVSAAQRTQETWKELGIEGDTPMKTLTELYDGVPSTYLNLLSKLGCGSVLMIGHNPTIASLVDHFLRDGEIPIDLSSVPTGATAALTFDTDSWEEVIRMPGLLKAWVIPRSLTDED